MAIGDGANVGDVHLEGRLEYDSSGTPAFMAAMRRDIQRHLPDISKDLNSAFGKGAADGITSGVRDGVSKASHDRDHVNKGKAIGQLIALGASGGIHENARFIRDAMIVAVVPAAAVITSTFAAAVQAAFAIAPAALVALPGLFLGTAGAIGVAALALHDFKDLLSLAIKPGAESLQELQEKLKGLTPIAREFWLELQAGAQHFQNLSTVAHNQFYIPLHDNAQGIIDLFRSLKDEVGLVAGNLGTLASRMLDVATSTSSIRAFEDILRGVDAFLTTIGPAMGRLFDAIIQKGREGAAFAETFGLKVSAVLDWVANWLNTHSLAKLFEDAKPALEDIKRILDAVVGTIQTLFGGDQATSGGGPLEVIADLAEGLERAAVKIKQFIDMVAALPPHVQQLIAAAGVIVLLKGPITDIAVTLLGAAEGVRGFAIALTGLGLSVGAVSLIIAGVATAIIGLAAVFVTAWTRSEEFRNKIISTWQDIKTTWEQDLKPTFQEIFTELDRTLTEVEGLLAEFGLDWGDLGTAIRISVQGILGTIQLLVSGFRVAIEVIQSQIAVANAAVDGFKEAWSTVGPEIQGQLAFTRQIVSEFTGFLRGEFDISEILGPFKNAWADVENFLAQEVFQPIMNGLRQVGQAFDDFFSGLSGGGGLRSGGASLNQFFSDLRNTITGFINDIKAIWQGLAEDIGARINAIRADFQQFQAGWNILVSDMRAAWQGLRQDIDGAIQGIRDAAGGLADFFRVNVFDPIVAGIDVVRQAFSTLFSGLGGQSIDSGGLTSFFDTVRSSIESFVNEVEIAWGRFRDTTREVFEQVRSDIQGAWQSIEDTVFSAVSGALVQATNAFNDFRTNVSAVWEGVRQDIESAANSIVSTAFANLTNFLTNDLPNAFNGLRQNVSETWAGIRQDIEDTWNNIRDTVFNQLIQFLTNDLLGAFNRFRDEASAAFDQMRDRVTSALNTLRDATLAPFRQFLTGDLISSFNQTRDQGVAAFDQLRDRISGAISNLRSATLDPLVAFVRGPLIQAFDHAKNSIVGIWETLFRGMQATWDKIIGSGRDKMNALIDLINAVIDIVNKVPFITKIDKLGKIGAPAAGAPAPGRSPFRAKGGPVEGGPLGTDTVPALGPQNTRYWLDNGEHIWTKKEVQNAGGHSAMYEMRKMFRHDGPGLGRMVPQSPRGQVVHMATGGRVGGENEGLLQSHRDHVHVAMSGAPMSYPDIIAKAKKSGIPHSVGSTYRPGSRGSGGGLDHHSSGRAVDFPGFNQDKFASFWEGTAGVIELIHRTNARDYAIFGGSGGGGSSWLQTAAGKAIVALIDKAFGTFKAALPKPDGIVGNVINAIFSKIPEQLKSHFESQVSANGPQEAGGNPDPAVMQTAYSMAKGLGASNKVLLALFEAGFVESGFRNLGHQGAKNDHDSLGFLQQRPSAGWPNPMDVKTATRSFVTRAMAQANRHVRAGTLAQAVQVSAFPGRYQQNRDRAVAALRTIDPKFDPNGYDQGGILPPGPSLAYNHTGRPETVLNPRHSAFVGRVLSGESLVVENHLYVDGEPIRIIAQEQVVQERQAARREEMTGRRV